ncbi:MAG: hypothetical protein CVU47_10615 [Chloroflexi bacterium HGW-Chloroflexi-9]|jgi:hypothetical protein|nr:MAG: hypothetical protein CVU47_10615 [Chloroflexi bacterium HGW-Chloroflexi-9]
MEQRRIRSSVEVVLAEPDGGPEATGEHRHVHRVPDDVIRGMAVIQETGGASHVAGVGGQAGGRGAQRVQGRLGGLERPRLLDLLQRAGGRMALERLQAASEEAAEFGERGAGRLHRGMVRDRRGSHLPTGLVLDETDRGTALGQCADGACGQPVAGSRDRVARRAPDIAGEGGALKQRIVQVDAAHRPLPSRMDREPGRICAHRVQESSAGVGDA